MKTFTREQSELVKQALRKIAGMCDGAYRLDGCGFSKNDADFGRSLADYAYTYSEKQMNYAVKLAYRYRRQLDVETNAAIKALRDARAAAVHGGQILGEAALERAEAKAVDLEIQATLEGKGN